RAGAARLARIGAGAVFVAAATAAGQPLMQGLSHSAGSAPREDAGRILWQFEMADMTRQSVKVGHDGAIYAGDRRGLYALSPDGELVGFQGGVGGRYPIDIAPWATISARRVR